MNKVQLIEFARTLRKEQTHPETIMWHLIKNRQVAGLKFRRQHPIDPYILDFYCAQASLAIELDGSQHQEPDAIIHDEDRTRFLNSKGIRVIRFKNDDVLMYLTVVIDQIYEAVLSVKED